MINPSVTAIVCTRGSYRGTLLRAPWWGIKDFHRYRDNRHAQSAKKVVTKWLKARDFKGATFEMRQGHNMVSLSPKELAVMFGVTRAEPLRLAA